MPAIENKVVSRLITEARMMTCSMDLTERTGCTLGVEAADERRNEMSGA